MRFTHEYDKKIIFDVSNFVFFYFLQKKSLKTFSHLSLRFFFFFLKTF